MVLPAQWPLVAIATAPGGGKAAAQQPIGVVAPVEGMAGFAHHVAVRSGTPPSREETSCPGGTFSAEGFEISRTPVESMTSRTVVEADLTPSRATLAWRAAGPPLR